MPVLEVVIPVLGDVMPVLDIIALQVPGIPAAGVEVPGVDVPGALLGVPGVFSGAVLFPGVRGALFGDSPLLGVTGVRLGAVLGLTGVDV
jgi:hypothetical protein